MFAELDSPEIPATLGREDSESDTWTDSDDSIFYEAPDTPPVAVSTPSARGQFASFEPPRCLLDLSGDYESDEEDFRFFRQRGRLSFDSTVEESVPDRIKLPDCTCPDPISCYVCIDDFNTIEKVRIDEAEAHITTNKRELKILALKSERQFDRVKYIADEIGMRVNAKKNPSTLHPR